MRDESTPTPTMAALIIAGRFIERALTEMNSSQPHKIDLLLDALRAISAVQEEETGASGLSSVALLKTAGTQDH